MIDIDTILDNIDEYENNIDDLIKALRRTGIKNFDEFKAAARKAGVPVKKSIQDQVASKFINSDDDDWSAALQDDTEESYLDYLKNYPDGKHRDEARSHISRLQAQSVTEESDSEWNGIDKEDTARIRDFISKYPDSKHIGEAKTLLRKLEEDVYFGTGMPALSSAIKTIETEDSPNKDDEIYNKIKEFIDKKKITVEDLLDAIRNDNNFISGGVANKLYENDIVSANDFSNAGISDDFIKYMMHGTHPKILDTARRLEQVTKIPCTEIYFWGIPSSGKSCAIGAILSAANNGNAAVSMIKDSKCQGYGYMSSLSDLFGLDGNVGTLPERTMATLSTTYEMGFELEDSAGKVHPITCIDIAGEVFCDIHRLQAKGKDSLDADVYSVLHTLNGILIDNRTDNRKIHFFVIEYGAEDKEYKGIPQRTYLQSAVEYIYDTGIFKKDTDAVYILVTKVDKAKATGNNLVEKLRTYISSKYSGFYNVLKRICTDYEINKREVVIVPFTLGDVCFQYYCRFNVEAAANVVRMILTRSAGFRKGKWAAIIDKLKK